MLRLFVAICFAAAAAAAQCFEPAFGPLLGHGDDGSLQPLRPIGFPFPFAGTTWSHVHVSNNGMLYLTHGGASGGSPTGYSDSPAVLAANLRGAVGQPPRIAPFWRDLVNFAASDGGVFLDNSRSDRCVITWKNTVEWGTTVPKTIQCQLFRTGALVFWYSAGMRVLSGTALVGISQGGGIADPGPSDLAPSPFTVPGCIAFQTFAAAAPFDLAGRTVTFVPDGNGGYAVSSPVCAPASNTSFGAGCGGVGRASFYAAFAPAAAAAALDGGGVTLWREPGGYAVLPLQAAFLPPTAAAAVLPLADEGLVQVPLGQPFPHGGGTTSSLWVASNGLVSLAAPGPLLPNGSTPNAAGLLAASAPTFCLWHDFDPSLSGSGRVRAQVHGTHTVITWDGVWDYAGQSAAAASTFQWQFDAATGNVHFACGALSRNGATGWLLGYSPAGPCLDPGPTDLPIGSPLHLRPDRPALALTVAPAPVLGRSIVFVTGNIPPSTQLALQVISFGLFEPGLLLAPFGAPGCLQSVDLTAASFVPLLRPGSDLYGVLVPNVPGLIGRTIASQSLALDPLANALGIATSNGVRSVLNTF